MKYVDTVLNLFCIDPSLIKRWVVVCFNNSCLLIYFINLYCMFVCIDVLLIRIMVKDMKKSGEVMNSRTVIY